MEFSIWKPTRGKKQRLFFLLNVPRSNIFLLDRWKMNEEWHKNREFEGKNCSVPRTITNVSKITGQKVVEPVCCRKPHYSSTPATLEFSTTAILWLRRSCAIYIHLVSASRRATRARSGLFSILFRSLWKCCFPWWCNIV